ncbi:MAG: cyclic nucleotide-binding domain-containing protein [Myxococcota bacterium]|nr:cyclic nucleotide-binding domain-containing protein [Myxococcota bacterium]
MTSDDELPSTTAGARGRASVPSATDSEIVTRIDTSRTGSSPEDVEQIVREVQEATHDRHARITTIGSGGMGEVDLVSDRALQRRAVLKRIHQHLATDPRTVRMFVREAQITGQLEHPNIVPVHDLGVDGERALYFTMKLVEGRTLERIVRDLPDPPLEHATLIELLEIVIKMCDALAFAHSRGIIHCDVKPANVMVGDFGEVYLMDWGVARRASGEESKPAVESGDAAGPVLIGTASFMAPEQALGKNESLDERTDVFAVGAILYHLLARRAPFTGEHFWAIIAKAQACAHPPLEEVALGPLPRALARIVAQAMSPEPADRFASVAALQSELVRFVRGGDSFPQASFVAGESIVREGESGDAAYIIKSGRCRVTKTIDGTPTILREMGPGDVFGEMAILAPGPRTATVTAIEPTSVHIVTAETLDAEVDAMKPWMGAFVRTLAQRFREREDTTPRDPKP